MKIYLLLLVIGLNVLLCQAQKEPVKYGKLSPSDIELTNYQNSEAVILCDYGNYYYDGRVGQVYFYFSRTLRIKILSEEGLKQARQTISYYDLSKATVFQYGTVCEIKAQTINVGNDGKLKKSKVKPQNIEKSLTDEDFRTSIIVNFPDVKVGSIIEYKVSIPTIDIVNPQVWYYQSDIPTLYSEVRLLSPVDIDYSAKNYNFDDEIEHEITSQISVMSFRGGSSNYYSNQMRFVKTNIPASDNDDLQKMYTRFILSFASSKHVLSGMRYLFRATDPAYLYKDKSEKTQTLNPSGYLLYKKPELEDIPKNLMKDSEFGPSLYLSMGNKDTIKALVKETSSNKEKMENIFTYVSETMEWNNLRRVYVSQALPKLFTNMVIRMAGSDVNLNPGLAKPLRKQSGTSAEINFILINMLRGADIRAYPVLVSTIDKGFLDPTFFNLHQFNHVVVLVEIKDESFLLDAAMTNDNTNILNSDYLNNIGLVIKNTEAYWIKIKEN